MSNLAITNGHYQRVSTNGLPTLTNGEKSNEINMPTVRASNGIYYVYNPLPALGGAASDLVPMPPDYSGGRTAAPTFSFSLTLFAWIGINKSIMNDKERRLVKDFFWIFSHEIDDNIYRMVKRRIIGWAKLKLAKYLRSRNILRSQNGPVKNTLMCSENETTTGSISSRIVTKTHSEKLFAFHGVCTKAKKQKAETHSYHGNFFAQIHVFSIQNIIDGTVA